MNKKNTKELILKKAAEIIQKKGFNNTGIQEILDAVKVPKGSFYFYFKSKKELGLELIDFYSEGMVNFLNSEMNNQNKSPLKRIKEFFAILTESFVKKNYTGGCPIGNLSQEMGDLDEAFRLKLKEAFSKIDDIFYKVLTEAQEAGEINKEVNIKYIAHFLNNSWEGCILRMKVERDIKPLETFSEIIFNSLLK